MAYAGKRKTVPSSRWATVIDVLEEWHVSFDDYLAAPAELLDEWEIRIQSRRIVEYREAKRREKEANAHRRRKK